MIGATRLFALALLAASVAAFTLSGSVALGAGYQSQCPFTDRQWLNATSDSAGSQSGRAYPRWPRYFNATLAKVNTEDSSIQWCPMYYDSVQQAHRFDFVAGYQGVDCAWGHLSFTILFRDGHFYHIFHDEQRCCRAGTLPIVSRDWLASTHYTGHHLLRNSWAESWQFAGEEPLEYWARDDEVRTPLRSFNQVQDPGATDWFDVVVGPQHPDLFRMPPYPCPPCQPRNLFDFAVDRVDRVYPRLLSGQWHYWMAKQP